MVSNDLVEISLRDGEEEVNLRRPNTGVPGAFSSVANASNPWAASNNPLPPPPPDVPANSSSGLPAGADADAELIEIPSPMVGTFYSASDPESPPFVDVGTRVHSGMVVCILEAMKVFNEIKAEVSGTIERILVKNAEAVEFGQPLFLVRPS
jgi:acetyl-CoA carboxylase biotin carboxyl carrier protein